jgi:hypothetical protein
MSGDPNAMSRLESILDRYDERLRVLETDSAGSKVTLGNTTHIVNQLDDLRKQITAANDKHEKLMIMVHQNAMVVSALKLLAASVIPLFVSVLITFGFSWFRLGNGS